MGGPVHTTMIKVYNRVGGCNGGCGHRLRDLDVRVGSQRPTTYSSPFVGGTQVGEFEGPGCDGQVLTFNTDTAGRYGVLVQNSKRRFGADHMNLAEIEVFGSGKYRVGYN